MCVRDYFEKELGVADDALLDDLCRSIEKRRVKKGEILVRAGERPGCISLLWRGICRGFLVDEHGKDITDCFCVERGDIIHGCNQLEDPSSISIEALTESEVLDIPWEKFQELLDYSEMLHLCNNYLMNGMCFHWEMKILLCECSAKERYEWFLNKYPGLIDRVKKCHVASFLNMTPVTLSRLRRKPSGEESGE